MPIKRCATVTLLFATLLLGACGVAPVATVDPEATSEIPPPTEAPEPTATPLPPATATEAVISTPTSPPTQEPSGEPMLKMVLITAKSPQEVEQLRQMRLDIVRVRPVDSEQTPAKDGKDAFVGKFIVEAVVPSEMLPKLKNMGFEFTEGP